MTAKTIRPYQPAQIPPLNGSEKQWLQNELSKLAQTLADVIAAIKQLQGVVTGL